DPRELHLHHDARAGVLRAHAGPHFRHDRGVRRARSVPVLRHVGRDAHPDVFHHRDVGRAKPPVRRAQVLRLHVLRIAAHAGRDRGARLPRRPAHLGFVMLGIWALTLQSVQGALMVMINHGISTGALFFLVGMLYERRHTRQIDAFGGIAKVVPLFAAVLTIVSLSSIGLPATNGFVGEFLVLVGAFRTYPAAAVIAAVGVIVAAMYLLPALP